jgi:hypothetical protein
MKQFFIEFKEISYGVVEVYAETEAEAREIANIDGTKHIKNSTLELGTICSNKDM